MAAKFGKVCVIGLMGDYCTFSKILRGIIAFFRWKVEAAHIITNNYQRDAAGRCVQNFDCWNIFENKTDV